MQTSLQPRLHLEIGLVRLVHAGRLRSIEEALSGLPRAGRAVHRRRRRPRQRRPEATGAQASGNLGDLKQDLYQALSKEELDISADAIEQAEVVVQGAELVLKGPKSLSFALKDKSIERLASQILGKP